MEGYQQYNVGQKSAGDFSFRKRREKIDWRKIAGVDIDMIARTLNFNSLQDNILNVAFCDIQAELDLRGIDLNYIKLFQLAQLIIEYLLHSQEYLCSNMQQTQLTIDQLTEELGRVKAGGAGSLTELERIRVESHKRKRIIATQQRIMQHGRDSYHKCPHCPKAFMSTSFLAAHVNKRHPEGVAHECPASRGLTEATAHSRQLTNELEALREQLRLAEQRLADEISRRNALDKIPTGSQNERELRRQLEAWQDEQLRAHRAETEDVTQKYLKELRELGEKKRLADEALAALQKSQGFNFGSGSNRQDDFDALELKRQREQLARLSAQSRPEKGVVDEFDEEEDKNRLREKLSETLAKSNRVRQVGSAPPRQDLTDLRTQPVSGVGDMQPMSDDELTATFGTSLKSLDMGSLGTSHRAASQLKKELEQNPGLLRAVRLQLEHELEVELNKRGVKPGSTSVPNPLTNAILLTLKTERLGKAQRVRNFFDIRNRYAASVDQQSIERAKKQPPPAPPAATNPPTRRPVSASAVTPGKEPEQRASRAGEPARNTALSPIPQSVNASMASAPTLSESSGRWDSDDDDFEPDELDADGKPAYRQTSPAARGTSAGGTVLPGNRAGAAGGQAKQQQQQPQHQQRQAVTRDDESSDFDDVSEIVEDVRVTNSGGTASQSTPYQSSSQPSAVSQPSGARPGALRPALKPSPRLSPRPRGGTTIDNESSLRSLSSLEGGANSPSPRRSAAPVASSTDPSTSVWGSVSGTKGGKKLRNSVTFSDDLESTDGGGMSLRDL